MFSIGVKLNPSFHLKSDCVDFNPWFGLFLICNKCVINLYLIKLVYICSC